MEKSNPVTVSYTHLVNVREYFERSFGLHVYVINNSKTKALWQIKQYSGELDRKIIFCLLYTSSADAAGAPHAAAAALCSASNSPLLFQLTLAAAL